MINIPLANQSRTSTEVLSGTLRRGCSRQLKSVRKSWHHSRPLTSSITLLPQISARSNWKGRRIVVRRERPPAKAPLKQTTLRPARGAELIKRAGGGKVGGPASERTPPAPRGGLNFQEPLRFWPTLLRSSALRRLPSPERAGHAHSPAPRGTPGGREELIPESAGGCLLLRPEKCFLQVIVFRGYVVAYSKHRSSERLSIVAGYARIVDL